MTKYKLFFNNNNDIELESPLAPLYPFSFEEKINKLAEENITIVARDSSIAPCFVPSFCIKGDKWNLFLRKVVPHLGLELREDYYWQIWDIKEKN